MIHKTPSYQPEGHTDEELVAALEPDQLTTAANQPYPPAAMTRTLAICLFALRVLSIVATATVVWIFVEQVRATH